jgi:hypothetical protein
MPTKTEVSSGSLEAGEVQAHTPGPHTASQCELIERAANALQGALSEALRNVCMHEETHRGGAIWEICDWCGCKWADDEGGRPKYKVPPSITRGYSVLSLLRAATGEAA